MDWTIVAGAAGAVLGSGVTLGGMWLTARQRERADRQAAWLRQLEMALGELAEGTNPERRFAGRTILESLMVDKRVPAANQALARSLLRHERSSLADEQPGHDLDGPDPARDNEGSEGGRR